MKHLLLCVALPAIMILAIVGSSGCSSVAAGNANNAIELSAISYQKNVTKLVEAFIADYRATARTTADSLYEKAKASVTGADGKVNAATLEAVTNKRLADYAETESNCIAMRNKLILANTDIDHILALTKQMREYFASANKMSISMNDASGAVMDTIGTLIAKKPRGEVVLPIPHP